MKPLFEGFNGAALREGRNHRGRRVDERARRLASMGPPSEKGGIHKLRGSCGAVHIASMGPPSEKGGIAAFVSLRR